MNDMSDSPEPESESGNEPEKDVDSSIKKKVLFAFDSPQELQKTLPLSIDLAHLAQASLSNLLIHDDELLQACDLPSSREVLSNLGRTRPFTLSQFKRDVDRQIEQMRKQIDLLCKQYSIHWDFQEQQSPLVDYMQKGQDTDVIVLSRCSWKSHLAPRSRWLEIGRVRYAPFGFVYDGSDYSEKAFQKVLYFCEQLKTDLVLFVPGMAAEKANEMVTRATFIRPDFARRIFLVDLDHEIETGNIAKVVNSQQFSALFLPLDEWVLQTLELRELEGKLKTPLVLLRESNP